MRRFAMGTSEQLRRFLTLPCPSEQGCPAYEIWRSQPERGAERRIFQRPLDSAVLHVLAGQ